MFKVHFQLKGTEYQLVAKSLDLSHPYFVSIKDMDLSYEEGLVVNPQLENTRLRFRDVSNIMIPFQCVSLIETVPAKDRKESRDKAKVVALVDGSESAPKVIES